MRSTNQAVVKQLQAHILDQFGTDYGWSSNNAVANLTEQIGSMRVGNNNNYQTGLDLVDGGTFLAYYSDVSEFLNGLGINPDNKQYDSQKVWHTYRHLLAREISKLVNSQVYA